MNETFAKWCELRDVQPIGARPVDVANFICECASLGIETLWPIVGEISRAHYLKGFSDPTLSLLVNNAINDVTKIEPPRSWNAEEKQLFLRLPHDVQQTVLKREMQRDTAVKQAFQRAADAERELAAIQQPTKVTDGNQPNPAA